MTNNTEIHEEDKESIENFILRVRRITDGHSLGKREELEKLLKLPLTVNFRENQFILDKEEIINEESIESLASIIRPFTLKGESLYICKILESVKNILKSENDLNKDLENKIDNMEKEWDEICSRPPTKNFYSISGVSNFELGWLWYYSDLIHNSVTSKLTNLSKEQILETSYENRFEAGVILTSLLTINILDIFDLIIEYKNVLNLNNKIFDTKARYSYQPLDSFEIWINEDLNILENNSIEKFNNDEMYLNGFYHPRSIDEVRPYLNLSFNPNDVTIIGIRPKHHIKSEKDIFELSKWLSINNYIQWEDSCPINDGNIVFLSLIGLYFKEQFINNKRKFIWQDSFKLDNDFGILNKKIWLYKYIATFWNDSLVLYFLNNGIVRSYTLNPLSQEDLIELSQISKEAL